jgi:hypothetical protein
MIDQLKAEDIGVLLDNWLVEEKCQTCANLRIFVTHWLSRQTRVNKFALLQILTLLLSENVELGKHFKEFFAEMVSEAPEPKRKPKPVPLIEGRVMGASIKPADYGVHRTYDGCSYGYKPYDDLGPVRLNLSLEVYFLEPHSIPKTGTPVTIYRQF